MGEKKAKNRFKNPLRIPSSIPEVGQYPNRPPLLALDLGEHTGWAGVVADWPADHFLFSGVQHFPLYRGESVGMRFLRFKSWLGEMIERGKPAVLVYEAAIAFHASMYSAQIAHGMAAILQVIAMERKVEMMTVTPSELKRFATGKGNSPKPVMLAAAREQFPGLKILDDNHADALFLLRYAMDVIGGRP